MKRLLFCCALLCCFFLGCGSETPPRARSLELPRRVVEHLDVRGPTITIATYNVNLGRSSDRPTLDALAAIEADVIFLQETTSAWEATIRKRLAPRYPFMKFRHCCGAGGLGVLSKRPFSEREYVMPRTKGAWFPAWRVVLETAGPDPRCGPIQAINVHLRPNISDGGSVLGGLVTTPPVRRAEIAEYTPLLEGELPALVVGDFNEPSSGGALAHLSRLGMKTALRPGLATWHWSTTLGEVQEQLDHVVFGPELRLIHAEVLREGRSDHYPVIARFSCP